MGKVEDMRAMREALHGVTPTTATEPSADEGKCSVCGKRKAVQRGLIASHQKGMGKMCPGSRQPPG
jgi:hypothetical protein